MSISKQWGTRGHACLKWLPSGIIFLVYFTCKRAFVIFLFQGTNASALEKDIGPEQFPINEHYFGLVNVSI